VSRVDQFTDLPEDSTALKAMARLLLYTQRVYELSAEQRACPCCGVQRKEIGAEQSWQVEYLPGHLERIQHVRKKYACPSCEINGNNPRMETAAKPETAIEKGMAGPGLLAYIVTSKFSDYLPLYRLEDIFARQGFEISRATQSVRCGDVADLVEPLYELMAGQVRASHVVATDDTIMPMLNTGKTSNARMWVYVGDDAHPYNVFDFTLNRCRDGPKYFLKDYSQVLLADAYGGYNGVVAGNRITRAGCWAHWRRKAIEAEKAAPEMARTLRHREEGCRSVCLGESRTAPEPVGARVAATARKANSLERATSAEASHGRSDQLRPKPMAGTHRVLLRWRSADRQQRQRARNETRCVEPQELALRRQRARRQDGGHPGQPDKHL